LKPVKPAKRGSIARFPETSLASLSFCEQASATGGHIIAFNVRSAGAEIEAQAKQLAVDILPHRVIYHLIDQVISIVALPLNTAAVHRCIRVLISDRPGCSGLSA
jgi:translation initiation factor IF-2